MIPSTLEGWTLGLVRELVAQGVFETERFDFKEMLPHPKEEEGKRRLRRDVAAFANSGGGFLVYGVKNDKGLPVDDRIVGIEAAQDFPEHFGNYPSGASPSLSGRWAFRNPPISLPSGRVVHVVHVPSSDDKPHGIFEDHRWWFCKRTNKGTEMLSLEEIRELFVGAESLHSNLSFFRSELYRLYELAEQQQGAANWPVSQIVGVRYNTTRLEAVLPLIFSALSRRSSWLVRHVDALRNAAYEADAWLSAVSPLGHLNNSQSNALRMKVVKDAARVREAAKNAFVVFDQVFQSLRGGG